MHLIDCYTELMVYVSRITRPDITDERTLESVVETVDLLINRSREKAREAGFEDVLWLEGFFPVCAWVDETILCSAWEGGKGWGGHQLQRKYFNTNNAGEEFFKKMEEPGAMPREVREIYDCCLSLGFMGRYYQKGDRKRLDDIKDGLVSQIAEGDIRKLPDALFEDAYGSGRKNDFPARKRFREPSLFTVGMFLLPVAVVTLLYVFFTYDLGELVVRYFGSGM
ncbi:MAG: DotU family type IV/VI secretion system protein [Chlorobiales bacterium]|nr:DotU family type IV/VI secretion system protein [Chlorobiales bacterium]